MTLTCTWNVALRLGLAADWLTLTCTWNVALWLGLAAVGLFVVRRVARDWHPAALVHAEAVTRVLVTLLLPVQSPVRALGHENLGTRVIALSRFRIGALRNTVRELCQSTSNTVRELCKSTSNTVREQATQFRELCQSTSSTVQELCQSTNSKNHSYNSFFNLKKQKTLCQVME